MLLEGIEINCLHKMIEQVSLTFIIHGVGAFILWFDFKNVAMEGIWESWQGRGKLQPPCDFCCILGILPHDHVLFYVIIIKESGFCFH